jgi:hypothetical protein
MRSLGLSTVVVLVIAGGCEQTNLDPMLADGAVTDALPCPICADVSADAVFYDSAEASIYATPPRPDAGNDDATVADRDAGGD